MSTAGTSDGATVVRESRARSTGAVIWVIDNRDGSFDTDDGNGWFNLCCTHGMVCSHGTRRLATDFAAEPETWCHGCQRIIRERELREQVARVREVLGRIGARYRLSSAIGHVCGLGTPSYGPMVNLVNGLKDHPGRATEWAVAQVEEMSDESSRQRLDQLTAILAAVDGFELGDEWVSYPPETIPALTAYRDEMARLMEENTNG